MQQWQTWECGIKDDLQEFFMSLSDQTRQFRKHMNHVITVGGTSILLIMWKNPPPKKKKCSGLTAGNIWFQKTFSPQDHSPMFSDSNEDVAALSWFHQGAIFASNLCASQSRLSPTSHTHCDQHEITNGDSTYWKLEVIMACLKVVYIDFLGVSRYMIFTSSQPSWTGGTLCKYVEIFFDCWCTLYILLVWMNKLTQIPNSIL